jgi:hypothetical protein
MLLSLTIQSGPGSNRWSAGLVYAPHVSALKLPESSLARSLKSIIGAHPEQSGFTLHQWFLKYGERTPRVSCTAPYTLSVKLSDFTVGRHTWRKNWVNCAGVRTVLSSRLSHRELRSSLRKSHSFLSLPADTTMASSQGTSFSSNSFSKWASMIYSFSNTTSYSTFYALFSYFRITWWPMWLANSKRQPCFYPPQSHAQEETQN